MRILKELKTGFTTYFQAISFINRNRLWLYILIPALINLLIFVGGGTLLWNYTNKLSAWFIDLVGVDTLAGTLGNVLEWIMAAIVKLISFFIYFKFYRYAVLFLSAPALALIAERTQEILTGISHPFKLSQLVHDIFRGMGITLKNLLLELLLTIPLYILALIPLIAPVAGFLILCIESYFVGFSMIDYRNEFRRLSALQSRLLIRRHKGMAIGNGIAFNLMLVIPVAGVLFAPALGAVAASLAAEQLIEEKDTFVTALKKN
jgi:CysZ protein